MLLIELLVLLMFLDFFYVFSFSTIVVVVHHEFVFFSSLQNKGRTNAQNYDLTKPQIDGQVHYQIHVNMKMLLLNHQINVKKKQIKIQNQIVQILMKIHEHQHHSEKPTSISQIFGKWQTERKRKNKGGWKGGKLGSNSK